MDHPPTVILLVDDSVGAEGSCVEVIDHSFIAMLRIITAEVLDECRDFILKLDVKGFDDI